MDIAVEMVDQLTSSKYVLLRNSNGAIFANTWLLLSSISSTFFFPFDHHYVIYVDFERFIFVFQVLFFREGHQILYVSIFSIKLFLQCLIYCPFFIPSLLLSWGAASGKIASRPRVKLFGVRIGWSVLFSIFSSIRLIFQHLVRLLLTQPMSPVLSQWSRKNLLWLGHLAIQIEHPIMALIISLLENSWGFLSLFMFPYHFDFFPGTFWHYQSKLFLVCLSLKSAS